MYNNKTVDVENLKNNYNSNNIHSNKMTSPRDISKNYSSDFKKLSSNNEINIQQYSNSNLANTVGGNFFSNTQNSDGGISIELGVGISKNVSKFSMQENINE